MITGFFVANYTHIDEILANDTGSPFNSYSSLDGFLQQEVHLYTLLFVAVGILVSFFCVPGYFKRSKYMVLSRKGLIHKKAIFDDGATSLFMIICYIGIGGLFLIPYAMIIKGSVLKSIACFLMLSSYVIAFAGFLEFFRLGRFRKNKIFFVTAILVWWVFIPWMAALTLNFRMDFAASVSPFFGFDYAVSLLLGKSTVKFNALIVPCVAAGLMWLLAWQEQTSVERKTAG